MDRKTPHRFPVGGKGERGLTLIELMFGVLVVAISVVALYYMFITGNTLILEQYQRRIALEKAQAWMEQMEFYAAKNDTVPRSFRRTFTDELVPPGEGRLQGIVAECRIDVQHSTLRDPETAMPMYSDVSVEYRWTARSGREYKIELRSKL